VVGSDRRTVTLGPFPADTDKVEYRVLDSIGPIAPEWDELATRAGVSPFLRPGWFQAWWNGFGRGRLRIATLRRDGRLAGVAPLYRHFGTLLAVANVHSPLFALLAEDAAAERELVARLFEPNPLHTSLCYLDEAADGTVELVRSARAAHRRLLTVTMQRSPWVETRGSWDGFEAGLSGKFVRDLRRRRRQLEELGEVSVEVADGRERLEELLREAFRLEPSGWKEKRGTAIVSSPKTRRFYREVAEWAAPRDLLRFAFLRLDGRPIAFEYALEDGRWYFLKGGVDPEFRRFAPGKLLAHAMIERAFAAGLESFEFLGADEGWKSDWQPRHRELVLQHSFVRTPMGFGWGSAVAAWRLVGLPPARRTIGWAR
jgi:CelD/BcsL family acetyltransferase involved in cellulose biosynthesis